MNETTARPRLRWFRFNLRTMFVLVTLLALWLGWEAKIVRDRREALAEMSAANQSYVASADLFGNDMIVPTLPFWRRWLGDEAYVLIAAPPDYSDSKMKMLYRLFPEAEYIEHYREDQEHEMFGAVGAASQDAEQFAKDQLRRFMWPVLAVVGIFAWMIIRVVRQSFVEQTNTNSLSEDQ